MYRPHDRNDLERRTIEAHSLYIEALALLERLQDEVEAGSPGVGTDVMQAECLLAERRFVFIALLNELGHMPTCLKAKLPPREGGRRTEATADPDLAAMRRSYLAWRGEPASLGARPASSPMMNLGRVLTLLGILSVEDESAEDADEAAIAS